MVLIGPHCHDRGRPTGENRAVADDQSPNDHFWQLLAVTGVSFVMIPLFDAIKWGRIPTTLLISVVVIVSWNKSGIRRRHQVWGTIATLIAAAFVVSATAVGEPSPVGPTQGSDLATVLASSLLTIMIATAPVLILRRIVRDHIRITLDSVAGALAAYVLIGFTFTSMYQTLDFMTGDFFEQSLASTSWATFQYFSFVTMTTLGYGDLTPATTIGQNLAVLEALFGQLFLVSVVALFVANLGRVRTSARP
jgi:hypothetical protein